MIYSLCKPKRLKPRSAVSVSPVDVGQLALDLIEDDAHGGAPVEVAQLPDAVREVAVGIARPRFGKLPVGDGGGSVEIEVLRLVRFQLWMENGVCCRTTTA